MDYFKKSYLKILLFYLFFVILLSLGLHFTGTGYRPKTFGGSGPLSWTELFLSYKIKILFGSLALTIIGIYMDYWDFNRKNKNDDKNNI